MHVRILKRLLRSSCLPVRPSTRISVAPTDRISVKFEVGDFYEKSVEKLQIQIKSGIFRDDRSAFYCYRRHKIAIKALLYE